MFCQHCGTALPDTATFCSQCGRPTGTAAPTAPVAPATRAAYAGFWLRFLAYIIDSLILSVAGLLVLVILMVIGFTSFRRVEDWNHEFPVFLLFSVYFPLVILGFVGQWLYFAWLESSEWQATLGKKVLGLVVTDLNGQPVSFARATGRYFAKIISNLTLLIGYVMAGFTEKKQALHDMIASCLVLRRS